jgi:hypothetical protein
MQKAASFAPRPVIKQPGCKVTMAMQPGHRSSVVFPKLTISLSNITGL